MMSGPSISFLTELQRIVGRLVKLEKDAGADVFCWPFQNVPAFDGLLVVNPQQRERHLNSSGREKKPRFRTREAMEMGPGLFVPQEGDSAILETTKASLKMAASHKVRQTEEPMPTYLASEPSTGSRLTVHPYEMPLLREIEPSSHGWIEKAALASIQAKAMMKEISVLERAQIGAAAGGIAGAITYACLHPLDTVKTKLQTRGASQLYSGPLDVIVKTFRSHGVFGFYSGISAVLVGSMFSSAVYFGTCELGKALLVQVPSLPAVAVPPIAGALGNLVSSAILVPKELITQRMQAGAQGRSWEVFLRTVQNEGFQGLYTGYSAALVRNLPASVLSFSSFEYLKSAWIKKTGKNQLDPWQSVISGAVAGVISSALTTPLDVVKTRLMTQARSNLFKSGHLVVSSIAKAELQAKIAASTYEGITSTLKKIWLEEGWLGLTKGVVPRILYSACFSALGYFAFETARLALVQRHLVKRKLVVN